MGTPLTVHGWYFDPEDPRAPSKEVWEAMTAEERAQVVATLPADPLPLQGMGESDTHYDAVDEARNGLRRLFGERGRSVYVAAGMSVYYPNEPVFAPDILAVLDVSTHKRSSWIVGREGRGLDLVLEVCVAGDRRKDTVTNVNRYARLGIREYFVLLPERGLLLGHRLAGDKGAYVALTPHRGRFSSQVLDLELALEGEKVRFYTQGAVLPFQRELVANLESAVDQQLSRVAELELALEEERKAREETERQLAEVREELSRARGAQKPD